MKNQEVSLGFHQYFWNYLSDLNEILEFVNEWNQKNYAVWSLKKYYGLTILESPKIWIIKSDFMSKVRSLIYRRKRMFS